MFDRTSICHYALQIFAERPLTDGVAEVLVRDVMYLVALGHAMRIAILKVVIQASDVCLGDLRDTIGQGQWKNKFEVSRCFGKC